MLTQFESLEWVKNIRFHKIFRNGSPSFAENACKIILNNVDILQVNTKLDCLKCVKSLHYLQHVVDFCFKINHTFVRLHGYDNEQTMESFM